MVCSAMAVALLAGCASQHIASTGAPAVRSAQVDERTDKAIASAEKAVAKSPRNLEARSRLAHAYLAAGRFDSAATTFEDAQSLGDTDAHDALGLALSYVGLGRNADAQALLGQWRDKLPASDYGLAIALAGQPGQGAAVLNDALRSGDATAKVRQNLAYAYALDGRWAEARLLASMDVPADQLDARISQWAAQSRTDAYQTRVATLLGTPVRSDPGQPEMLALNHGAASAPAYAAADPAPAAPATGELAPATPPAVAVSSEGAWTAPADQTVAAVATPEPAPTSSSVALASSTPVKYVSNPIVQPIQQSEGSFEHAFATAKADTLRPSVALSGGTHLVQLGSFSTRAGAERAWGIYVARNPQLKSHTLRIVEAEVRGRRYYRVTAEGFDAGSSRSMCSVVKGMGGGCFAYSEAHQLPGALPYTSGGGAMRARK